MSEQERKPDVVGIEVPQNVVLPQEEYLDIRFNLTNARDILIRQCNNAQGELEKLQELNVSNTDGFPISEVVDEVVKNMQQIIHQMEQVTAIQAGSIARLYRATNQ